MKILLAFGFGVLALPACTAVLGMDRAELDEDVVTAGTAGSGGSGGAGGGGVGGGGAGGNAGSTSLPPPTDYPVCDAPSASCKSCMSGGMCAATIPACLGSPECRQAAYDYGSCLDAACHDASGCADKYLTASGNSQALAVGKCLGDDCVDRCEQVGTVVSTCEVYCGCMAQYCSDFLPAAACMDECLSLGANVAYCRWQHCEAALPDFRHHCDHAMGRNGFCPRPNPGITCDNKIHSGFPCKTGPDCCSNECDVQVCR